MRYPSYEFLIELHVHLMRDTWYESFYGPSRPELLQSALLRPRFAAHYESADGIRQAAYLFRGVLMNHGFAQGNKRTAYAITEWFLWENRLGQITADDDEIVAMCYAAENESGPWTELRNGYGIISRRVRNDLIRSALPFQLRGTANTCV